MTSHQDRQTIFDSENIFTQRSFPTQTQILMFATAKSKIVVLFF